MRGASLGGGLRLAALAATGLGVSAMDAARSMAHAGLALAASPLRREHHLGRTQYPKGHAPRGNSIADKPHKHEREIARRKRQAERNAERRAARADRVLRQEGRAIVDPAGEYGLSRRGHWVPL